MDDKMKNNVTQISIVEENVSCTKVWVHCDLEKETPSNEKPIVFRM